MLEGRSISLQRCRLSLHPLEFCSFAAEVLEQPNAAEARGSCGVCIRFFALPWLKAPVIAMKGWINALFHFQFERQFVTCSSLQLIEVVVFTVLLYLYKRRNVKHIVVVMLLVALLGTDKQKLPS